MSVCLNSRRYGALDDAFAALGLHHFNHGGRFAVRLNGMDPAAVRAHVAQCVVDDDLCDLVDGATVTGDVLVLDEVEYGCDPDESELARYANGPEA